MEDSRDLVARVEREIAASSKTSPTLPGQTEARPKPDGALVEAINQVFALFRLNYHNQYYAAFSDAEQLRQAKKLWLESLSEFPAAQVLHGAKRAIESSEYLPTLHKMREHCGESLMELGFPAPEKAYQEACNAPQPPEIHRWSHPVVYWAGQRCGWTMLATQTAGVSRPVFMDRYQKECTRVIDGNPCEPVPEPPSKVLSAQPASREAALAHLQKMREVNDL
ncbi:MAG: replication protein P [Pseudomonadota bacterium]